MDVNERVAKLERTVRRLTAALGGVVVLAVVLVAMGAVKEPGTIQAKEFMVVGENGEVRAMLAHTDVGTGLSIWDDKGKTRFLISVNQDGTCLLNVNDRQGRERVSLGISNDDQPVIELVNKDGKRVWSTP